ncbi:MAG: lysophospholipid acyltransferase family protein [Proteobacteria bacterium]|nr:lysophospholipid acyltransferase family protein [Pseudomonadota bacterium]MDA0982936.1 lysophospholipid acyltransferase family protein [Pseudomonadota bacterium]
MSSFPSVLMKIAAAFPLPIAHAFGALLGWAMVGLSPTYRRHLRENLEAAGYTDAATRHAAIAESGKLLAELPAMWLRPQASVTSLVREIRGLELVDAARAQGKGIVFLTPHLGCFEITAKAAAERFPITVLYSPPKLQWLRPVMEQGRGGENVRLASADLAGVRELLAALKRRETVGILPDQVPGEGAGEWADFFGKPAYTMTLAARFTQREGVECLIAYGERLPWGRGYIVHVRPLPEALEGETQTRRVNRALEMLIHELPGQYLWGYNRYKKLKIR